jgi:hypothetical protein
MMSTAWFTAADVRQTVWPDAISGFTEPAWVNLGRMLSYVSGISGETTLIVSESLSESDVRRFWRDGAGDGWRPVQVPTAWTTFRRGLREIVHVGVLPLLRPSATPLWRADAGAPDITRALAWYQAQMGTPFRMTPGVAGCSAIRATYTDPRRGRSPYWGRGADVWPRELRPAGDLYWSRTALSDVERARPWVHGFDLRGARLAAALTELCWDRPGTTGAIPFDPTLGGWWAVRTDQLPAQGDDLPPLFVPSSGALTWLSAPVARRLWDAQVLPEVLDSRTAPARQLLRPWVTRMSAARASGEAECEEYGTAAKSSYAETVGMMARTGGSVYRPDWYATIVDRQRVTVVDHANRVWAARRERPVAAISDCLVYTSDFEDPEEAAADLGLPWAPQKLGGFRSYSAEPMERYATRNRLEEAA